MESAGIEVSMPCDQERLGNKKRNAQSTAKIGGEQNVFIMKMFSGLLIIEVKSSLGHMNGIIRREFIYSSKFKSS